MRFADPGSAWIVVTPPAIASGICGSCGQNECSAQTSAVTGFVASLPSDSASVPGAAYTPRCEWSSIIPGVTNLPVPSTTVASAGAVTAAPTAIMRPSRSRMDPFEITCPVAVMIVALRINTGALACRWYVVGYCARLTLVDSCAAAGAGVWSCAAGRACPLAHATTSGREAANAHQLRNIAVSFAYTALFHQLKDERRTDELDFHDAARRRLAHVKGRRYLATRDIDLERVEAPRRHDHGAAIGDLDLNDLYLSLAGLEDAEIERLPGGERQGRKDDRQGVVVVCAGGDRGIDLNRLRRPVLLRRRRLAGHAPAAVGQVNVRRLTLRAPGLIDAGHGQIGGVESHRRVLLTHAAGDAGALDIGDRVAGHGRRSRHATHRVALNQHLEAVGARDDLRAIELRRIGLGMQIGDGECLAVDVDHADGSDRLEAVVQLLAVTHDDDAETVAPERARRRGARLEGGDRGEALAVQPHVVAPQSEQSRVGHRRGDLIRRLDRQRERSDDAALHVGEFAVGNELRADAVDLVQHLHQSAVGDLGAAFASRAPIRHADVVIETGVRAVSHTYR